MYMVITCYDYLWLICRNPEQNTIVTKPGRIHKLIRISYLTKVLFLVHYRDASCDWPPRPTNETWKIYYTNQLLINHPWSFDIDIHTWRYFVYVCAHIHTYTQIYVYIRVCIYIYMQIYIVFVCMHMIAILLMYFQINCKRERERAETKKREACAIWKCSAKNDMLPTTTVCPSFACVACVTGRGRNRSNHWSSGSCSHGCASSMLQWDSTTLASTIGGVSVTVRGIETVRERQSIADIRPLIKQTYRFF